MKNFESEIIKQAINAVKVCEKCGDVVYEIQQVVGPDDPGAPFFRLAGRCNCGHVTICVAGSSDDLQKFKGRCYYRNKEVRL